MSTLHEKYGIEIPEGAGPGSRAGQRGGMMGGNGMGGGGMMRGGGECDGSGPGVTNTSTNTSLTY